MIDTPILSFFIERKPHSLIFTSFEINFILFLVSLLRSKPIAQCDNDRDRDDTKGSKRHGNGLQIYSRTTSTFSYRRLVFPLQFCKQTGKNDELV